MNVKTNVASIFGINVFDDEVMKAYLPKAVYMDLKAAMDEGQPLNLELADIVAEAMKNWAVEKGATHFTHWFQPLTGITAEKHDSFVSIPKNGKVLLEFSGRELIKGEPDASSFPSGGMRSTFEARGYTVWDTSSPVFVREGAAGVTLCIPTAFCSYTGQSLDMKTPLLRSMEALNKQGLRYVRMMGDNTAERVYPSVGIEQEYFIIDREKYNQRKDLIYTRRTLFGARPPKGQEMDDHYFGSIRERIGGFMKDANDELWRLGIPAKTQHNEVAPGQHEFASIFEPANIAVDHNQLVMETIRKVSHRHGLKCLLHEKPYAGVNGSGKHNNWSLTTDKGRNLLDPGKEPHKNKEFLLLLTCILKAIDEHASLLRESAACVGNEHRLGADEAPPAIISVFLGSQLDDVLSQTLNNGVATNCMLEREFDSKLAAVPNFSKDATDRNRTSPFAFTGNKFEFRMVGSSDTVAEANIVLNTIIAKELKEVCNILEKSKDFDQEVNEIIAKYATEHRRIVFNGNGYSEEWLEEAKRRGLPNLPSMVNAIEALTYDKTIKIFEEFDVFTKEELESRAEIKYETYTKQINIEARTMVEVTGKQIVPAVLGAIKDIAEGTKLLGDLGLDPRIQLQLLEHMNSLVGETMLASRELIAKQEEASLIANIVEKACFSRDEVVPAMEALRKPIDELELEVDKRVWPMPSYGDLMFEV